MEGTSESRKENHTHTNSLGSESKQARGSQHRNTQNNKTNRTKKKTSVKKMQPTIECIFAGS